MKITANRREDILKQKEAFETESAAAHEQYEREKSAFKTAERAITDPIKEDLAHRLNQYRHLTFDISVSRNFFDKLEVRVTCNEDNKFDEDVALSWTYQAQVDSDGQVIRETSSWSGLKATTEAQMESLTETLEAIKYLNSIDWEVLLNKTLPDWDEYFKTDVSKYAPRNAPDFDRMLIEADIEEAIGKPILLKGYNAMSSRGYGRGESYYMVLKETPAQYEIVQIPGYAVKDSGNLREVVDSNKKYSYRLRKDKFIELLNKPIETLEVY